MKKSDKKKKPDKGDKILKSVINGLKSGTPNKDTSRIKKVSDLAESGEYYNQSNNVEPTRFVYGSNFLSSEDQKIADEIKRAKKSWTYRMWIKFCIKNKLFGRKMGEVWSFIKHEFITMRKLVVFINDLFFGKEIKNRKYFYDSKDKLIQKHGYYEGELKFNKLIEKLTQAAKINKRMIENYG